MQTHPEMSYIGGNAEPQDEFQKFIVKLTAFIESHLQRFIQENCDDAWVNENYPKAIITNVMTNTLVNLLMDSMSPNNSIKHNLNCVEEQLQDISKMTLKVWKAIEIEKVNLETEH